ncbi:MAG: hypothetical protein ACR2PS_10345 [Pseudomonadales bacterium]
MSKNTYATAMPAPALWVDSQLSQFMRLIESNAAISKSRHDNDK